MAYLKPQSPIKYGEDHIYPLTTVDQIIMDDGQRLSGVGVYLEKPEESEETTVTGNNADTLGGYTFDALKSYMLDLTHPIGSYYWSSESTDPASLFGGTWKQIKDQFILAAGDSYSVGATGGEAAHTLIQEEMPIHDHSSGNSNLMGNIGYHDAVEEYNTAGAFFSVNYTNVSPRTDLGIRVSYNGGSQAHNNMPPYLVAYCWRRTA